MPKPEGRELREADKRQEERTEVVAAWREGMPGGVRPSIQTPTQTELSQEAKGEATGNGANGVTAVMNDANKRSVPLETDNAFTTSCCLGLCLCYHLCHCTPLPRTARPAWSTSREGSRSRSRSGIGIERERVRSKSRLALTPTHDMQCSVVQCSDGECSAGQYSAV